MPSLASACTCAHHRLLVFSSPRTATDIVAIAPSATKRELRRIMWGPPSGDRILRSGGLVDVDSTLGAADFLIRCQHARCRSGPYPVERSDRAALGLGCRSVARRVADCVHRGKQRWTRPSVGTVVGDDGCRWEIGAIRR